MNVQASQIDGVLTSLGALLHEAARCSKAAIDAIPLDAKIEDEVAAIDAASQPAHLLADLILRMPGLGQSVRSQAQAWMDGKYFATFAEAA